jgi:hypothetical protein
MTRRRGWLFILALITAWAPSLKAGDMELRLEPSVAWRTDKFRWTIAGDNSGNNPNILSELDWQDIKIQELRLCAEALWPRRFALQAMWAGGRIIAGKNRDSDYLGDNHSFEFSRSNNEARMGDTREVRFGAGFPLGHARRGVMPMTGWAHASQRLFMTNGRQTVSNDYGLPLLLPPLGNFGGLNSHYEHSWRGPWIGAEGWVRPPRWEDWRLESGLRFYPRLAYYGEADWNLRDDFAHPKSYEQVSMGRGVDVTLSFLRELKESLSAGVELFWRRWESEEGTDRIFFNDGTTGTTRFNGAQWESLSLRFSLRFRPVRGESRFINDEEREDPLF